MRARSAAILGLALMGASSCGSSEEAAPDASADSGADRALVLDADASPDPVADGRMSAEADVGPPCPAPSVAGTAARSAEGILTNLPTFHFAKTGGALDMVTAYFELTKLAGFNSLVAWGDVENRTRVQQCIPAADQFDVGDQAVLTVFDGPAYELPGSTVPIVCLDPGGRAVFRSIQNDVDETLLDDPKTVAFAFSALVLSPPNRRHPDDPRVEDALATSTEGGWVLGGTMRGGERDIHALEARVYIRDPNGLIYNYLPTQIAALGTVPAHGAIPFETPPNAAQFCAFELFNVFIDGPEPVRDSGPRDAVSDATGATD